MTPNGSNSPQELDHHRFRLRVWILLLLPGLVAISIWLYLKLVNSSLGPIPIGIKILIPLDFLVLDDATGKPIQGAKVDLLLLHPSWRNRPELQDLDLRRDIYPAAHLAHSLTNEGGRTEVTMVAGIERRLKHQAYGLLPVAGNPEIVFSPTSGVCISADGHETWVKYLDDISKEDGRNLANGIALPVVVRLRKASLKPTSSRPVNESHHRK